jgi:hypothetical protein
MAATGADSDRFGSGAETVVQPAFVDCCGCEQRQDSSPHESSVMHGNLCIEARFGWQHVEK